MAAKVESSLADNLLISLSEQNFNHDELAEFIRSFDELIENQGEKIFKFSNEEVANTVYNMDNSEFESLKYNILLVKESLSTETSKNILHKFLHSISLSLIQREFILSNVNEANLQIVEIKKQINKNKTTSAKIEKQIAAVSETKSTIYADFVSILGIFTAIVFAIFGGTKILGSFFDHISTPTILNLGYSLIVGGIYFLGVFGLVLMMFSGIYKITHDNEKYKFSVMLIIISTVFSLSLIILGFMVVWSYYH